jgi:hypothetical protein
MSSSSAALPMALATMFMPRGVSRYQELLPPTYERIIVKRLFASIPGCEKKRSVECKGVGM